jgi:hypothetical protein
LFREKKKKALLFEKRSKNFGPCGECVGATLTPYKQEFFGSFVCKKERLAFFCLPYRAGGFC